MKNSEVARVFQDIADLLELKKENRFKIRAYQKVAHTIEHLPSDLGKLVAESRLKELPGVGEAITGKITELVTTGRLDYYDRLKSEFPEGIIALLDIPGIGPRTALLLSEMGISSVDSLETAIIDGKVSGLPGIGDRTAENILRQIRAMRSKDRRTPIGEVLPVVEDILAQLKGLPGLKNLTSAGSVRRFRETIGDIDLMGTADNAQAIIQAFTSLPSVREILGSGTTKASVITTGELQVDLRIVEHDSFGSLLQYFTGSKQHNIKLRERARRQGLSLSEYGITDIASNSLEKFTGETAFYERQGLEYIPPELREGQHEIAKAEQGTIPHLIELPDIRGDLHVHTTWSDGNDDLETMATAARELGYEYLGITEHSAGRGIAHGLDAGRVREQIAAIRDLNQRLDGIRILCGTEVDIRADGSLDLPDELLSELDIVIAAVHSGLNQNQEQMTARVIKAMENPHVDVLAHPTCRLLPDREPVDIDMEAIFQTAAKTSTMLEINAMPSRLDLKDTHAYRAKEHGVRLLINTDSHSTHHLDFMRFGVGIARRGWCEPRDILNTRPLREVLKYLKSRC